MALRMGIAAAVGASLLAGCAATAPEGALIADPFEGANRSIHAFNLGLDTVLLRPVSQVYGATPALLRHLVSNAVDHIRLPVTFFNYVLQGDADAALQIAGRFGVNTIVGAGGLLDPATEFGLPDAPTDFGLTLASYGAAEGVFLMLPVFGPATVRDAFGRAGDVALNPLTWVGVGDGLGEAAIDVAQIATPPVVVRFENGPLIDELFYESEDSYVAVRTAYVLSRRARVEGGVDVERLPDIFAE